MTQQEYLERIRLGSESLRQMLFNNAMFMSAVLNILVDRGITTEDEFNEMLVRIQPAVDQQIEADLDDTANISELHRKIVTHFRNL